MSNFDLSAINLEQYISIEVCMHPTSILHQQRSSQKESTPDQSTPRRPRATSRTRRRRSLRRRHRSDRPRRSDRGVPRRGPRQVSHAVLSRRGFHVAGVGGLGDVDFRRARRHDIFIRHVGPDAAEALSFGYCRGNKQTRAAVRARFAVSFEALVEGSDVACLVGFVASELRSRGFGFCRNLMDLWIMLVICLEQRERIVIFN